MERNEKKKGGEENKGTGKKTRRYCNGNRMRKRRRSLGKQIKEKTGRVLGENRENRKGINRRRD